MCTCELLVATMMGILIMFNSAKTLLNIEIIRLEIYLAERPMLKVRVAPHTSRHSALLDVADHSPCRMMFAVQCLECPLGRRWSRWSDRQRAIVLDIPQKPDRLGHPSRWHRRRRGSGGLLFQSVVRAHCTGSERGSCGATQQWEEVLCPVSRTRGWRQALLLINAEGGR
jgi:hypothetical protein